MTTADDSTPVIEEWVCTCCGYVYDPAMGDPESNIPPGTPFSQLPRLVDVPVVPGAEKGV